MRLLLAALVALAAARDHALLEQLLELEADVSELAETHTLERDKKPDDPSLTDEEREDAIGLAFGDEFKTGGAKQTNFPTGTSADYPGVENRAVSLTTLKNIKKWLDEAINMKTDKRLQDERSFIKSCKDDPTLICVSDGACLGTTGEAGKCEGRLQRTAATADMNLLNDLLVKPITKQMWETTSAAAGYDKEWKWDDPKWTQVAGSLAELLGPGPPDFFISHNWGGSFANFVDAVDEHFRTRVKGKLKGKDGGEKTEDNTFYWVCTFANNQHDPKHDIAEAGTPDQWGFAKALNVAKSVVSIQDDTQEGSFTLYRAWCAFEFWWAMRKGYPIDILCAPKADPTKEDPTRRNFVCGSDVCQQLKEFSIKPAPESSKIVGMFASQLTDYGKIKDAMMDGDDSWKPTLKIAWKPDTGFKSVDLTADIDAMKKSHGSDPKWTQVLASLETLSFLPINAASLKTLSFLPLKSACDQCRRCALQGGLPDVFHLAVHKLGKELECSKTSRYDTRRDALATSGVAEMTIAALIGAYPQLHPFLYAEGDREASFGTLAELAASGKAPQTKLMVAMNDAMQPVNEGTSAPDGPTEYLLVEVNFNPDLKLETVLQLDEDHVDKYIGEMGRPAGKFICEYFDGTGGWKDKVHGAFKEYVGELKEIAEAEQKRIADCADDKPDCVDKPNWKWKIAKRHAKFMVEASNYEPFPKSYELFKTGTDGKFLLKESYALESGENKQRKAHDNELANGGVNGWAKYTMGFTDKAAGCLLYTSPSPRDS